MNVFIIHVPTPTHHDCSDNESVIIFSEENESAWSGCDLLHCRVSTLPRSKDKTQGGEPQLHRGQGELEGERNNCFWH